MKTRETDYRLTKFYEENGLFSKIIDAPAEEAFRRGFVLSNGVSTKTETYAMEVLDNIHWEEMAVSAIKWARLYGGSLVVMLINDGKGLDDPLDWNNIRSVDGLRVYDRSVIKTDRALVAPETDVHGNHCRIPEKYHINSRFGAFTVHESRCLFFRNGSELHERSMQVHLWPWGIPEAFRIMKALQGVEISHGNPVRLLEKSIQPVHKIRELSQELATEDGEARLHRRIETVNLARGLLNTIAIDIEDSYEFLGEIPDGIGKIVDISDRMLSAVTGIPEIILWGKSVDYERPGKMWRSHDNTSMANWYDFVERIQTGMVKHNLERLLSVIFQGCVNNGKLPEIPPLNIQFSPLWSMNAMDEADTELARSKKQLTQAKEAEIYVNMGSIRPFEIRKSLFKKSRKRR